METTIKLMIKDTDWFFNDSPDPGERDCLCSRCHEQITEGQEVLRVPLDKETLVAHNKKDEEVPLDTGDGYEFRLCELCQYSMGIKKKSKK